MSEHPSTRSSRLPAPSSGIKPPKIMFGQTGKRTIDATTSSKGDLLGNPTKRPKCTVSNLSKVTKYVR